MEVPVVRIDKKTGISFPVKAAAALIIPGAGTKFYLCPVNLVHAKGVKDFRLLPLEAGTHRLASETATGTAGQGWRSFREGPFALNPARSNNEGKLNSTGFIGGSRVLRRPASLAGVFATALRDDASDLRFRNEYPLSYANRA
jgi:hypothetical protein